MKNDNIAQDLADEQREISVSEFFEKNSHMLGFDSEARALVTAIKEALDNSLDVCEDMEVLPHIKINVEKEGDYLRIAVEDNGPGIPEENVGKVYGSLLFGSRFQSRTQHRGQQGIGISAAVLYSQLTSNTSAKIKSLTPKDEKAYYAEVGIDTEINEPKLSNQKRVEWEEKEHGTRIELLMDANLRARKRLIKYLENTNVANPHAKIEYNGVKDNIVYQRATEELPRKPEEIKPHPYGIEIGNLEEILSETDSYSLKGCLTSDFSKVGSKTADKMIKKFIDDYYGRELPFSLREIDLDTLIDEAISNKKKTDIDSFKKKLNETLSSSTTKTNLRKLIEKNANKVEEENETRLGETVRENTFVKIYEKLKENDSSTIYIEMVDSSTTSRKSEEIISRIGEEIYKNLKDEDSVNKRQIKEIVVKVSNKESEKLNESFGDKAVEKVVETIWDSCGSKDKDVPKIKKILNNNKMLKSLHYAMKNTKVSRPSSKCLSPIGEEILEKGLRNNYEGDFYTTSIRDAGSHSGNPFLVEAGLVYGEDSYNSDSSIELDRFANRVPLVYQQGACSITRVVKNIGWRNYNLKQSGGSGIPQGPVAIVVHVASTNVPFTSESKDAIAGGEEMEHEIEQAVRDVGRDLKKYLNKQEKRKKKKEKRGAVYDVIPEIAEKFSKIAGEDTPDPSMSISNITDSIIIEEYDNKIKIYNKIGTRRKIRIEFAGCEDIEEESLEKENNVFFWEGVVYSSNSETIETGFNYKSLEIKEIDEEIYMYMKKGDKND